MAKRGADRVIPFCGKCLHRHYNNFGKGCPPQAPVVARHVPDGFTVLKDFGASELSGGARPTRGVQVVYRFPPRRGGSLTEPPQAA